MTIFAEKMESLPATVRLAANGPVDAIAAALREGDGRPAVAIGSGGSAIAAEYFARCRTTLGHAMTIVCTPMHFVSSQERWADFDVWIFSAGADNPDVSAALSAALGSSATGIRLVTVNAAGATAVTAAGTARCMTFVLPVADSKDGFLATHSLVAMTAGLLGASDRVAKRPSGSGALERFAQDADRIVVEPLSSVAGFRRGDTVVLLHDPQCRTFATLVETSLWETGIAPVQMVDFRNFAHGRHVWAAKHLDTMFTIALTTAMSREIWTGIRDALPSTMRRAEIDFGHAGRFRTAVSVVEGLAAILALGNAAGIDPGRPGRGEFAGAVYGDRGLAVLARQLDPAVRHKQEAMLLHDEPCDPGVCTRATRSEWMRTLAAARVGAIVLDYDGTVVATDARLEPPSADIIAELSRLAASGIRIAFATGRGGSAGEALRGALPAHLHPGVVMGYYNGGLIRTLDVDIEDEAPVQHPDLAALADWIEERGLVATGVSIKRGRPQITLNHTDVLDPISFASDVAAFPDVSEGRLRLLSSHHSFDLLPSGISKTSVCDVLRGDMSPDSDVLAVGDSGEPGGNDLEMLSEPPSISVDMVCGLASGCWTAFGRTSTGPAALLRILRALRTENGHASFDLVSLAAGSA